MKVAERRRGSSTVNADTLHFYGFIKNVIKQLANNCDKNNTIYLLTLLTAVTRLTRLTAEYLYMLGISYIFSE